MRCRRRTNVNAIVRGLEEVPFDFPQKLYHWILNYFHHGQALNPSKTILKIGTSEVLACLPIFFFAVLFSFTLVAYLVTSS